MQSGTSLAKLTAYKQFLIKHNFPENLPNYDLEAYWNARYEIQQQEMYDWYVEPHYLKDLVLEFISPSMNIMDLGCGKSSVLDSLYKWGYKNLIGADFSWTLINQKKNEEKYLKRGIRWERVDITTQWPQFQVNCFFEKATLDCLSEKGFKAAIDLIYSQLPQDGVFFHISSMKPEARITLLKKWDAKVYELPKTIISLFSEIDDGKAYYAYVCHK